MWTIVAIWLVHISYIDCIEHSAPNTLARTFMHDHCSSGYILDYKQPPFDCYSGPQSLLQYLLFPLSITEFDDAYYNIRPLYIARDNPEYYASIDISNTYQDIVQYVDTRSDIASKKEPLGFFPELVVTKYDSGKDQHIKPWRADQNQNYLDTLTSQQIALLEQYHVSLNNDLGPWDHTAVAFMQQNNYTLQWIQLEYHLMTLRNICYILSNQIGFGVRSNMDLTPALSRGYNVDYDIEDAFIIQINNSKHYKIYQDLHHYCSHSGFSFFDKSDLCATHVISELSTIAYDQIRNMIIEEEADANANAHMEFELKQGDFLYIPRGWMHQSDVMKYDKHSIQITFSVFTELYCDYFYQFVRYLFTVKEAKQLFKSLFYAKKVAAKDSGNIKQIRKNLLKELDPWLRTVSFTKEEMRDSVPLAYHMDIDGGYALIRRMIELFESYFVLFMRYVNEQSAELDTIGIYGSEVGAYIQRFMELFTQKQVKRKLKNKLKHHYNDALSSWKVYLPFTKKTTAQFKRISLLMRSIHMRKQLNNLT